MSVNKVILIGRLGKDPEVRYSSNGTAITSFSLATSRKFKKNDEFVEETEWHRVVGFGRTAEICGEYLNKGRQIFIEGRLQTREWEDKDGNRRWTTEVIIERMQMLGGKGDAAQEADSGDNPFDRTPNDIPDEDVPF